MKAKAYSTYILDTVKGLRSPSGTKNLLGALTSCDMINGRRELTPTPTAWILYIMFGCPSTNFNDSLLWVKDRRAESRQDMNEEKDTVIYALRQFLAKPAAIDETKAMFFFFSHDGRLTIIKEKQAETEILPKKIFTEDSKIVDALELHMSEETPGKGVLVPAAIMKKLVTKLAFTEKDLKAELKKVYA